MTRRKLFSALAGLLPGTIIGANICPADEQLLWATTKGDRLYRLRRGYRTVGRLPVDLATGKEFELNKWFKLTAAELGAAMKEAPCTAQSHTDTGQPKPTA